MRRDELLKQNPHVERLRLRKQRRIIRISIFSFSILVILFIGIGLLTKISKFSIHTVSVVGTRVIEDKDIQAVIERETHGNYVWPYSKKNIFIYPKNKIVRILQQEFPRIDTISIEQVGVNDISILISERMGVSLWCGTVFPEPAETPCYFVDEKGYIFARAPYFSGTVYFKWYGPTEDGGIVGSQLVLPSGFVSMAQFVERLRIFGLDPYLWAGKTKDTYSIFINRPGDTGVELLLSKKQNLDKVLEMLAAGFDSEPLFSLIKNGLPGITYIDARYEDKIYYK